MPGKDFEQGCVLGHYGGVEEEAGGGSECGLSNGNRTVVDAASGGTKGRFINDFHGLLLEGANVEFCVDSVRGQSNRFVHAKCLSTVKKGRSFSSTTAVPGRFI
jgi:hypothetical protein